MPATLVEKGQFASHKHGNDVKILFSSHAMKSVTHNMGPDTSCSHKKKICVGQFEARDANDPTMCVARAQVCDADDTK